MNKATIIGALNVQLQYMSLKSECNNGYKVMQHFKLLIHINILHVLHQISLQCNIKVIPYLLHMCLSSSNYFTEHFERWMKIFLSPTYLITK